MTFQPMKITWDRPIIYDHFKLENVIEPAERDDLWAARTRIAELEAQVDHFRFNSLKGDFEQARARYDANPTQDTFAVMVDKAATPAAFEDDAAVNRELRKGAQKLVCVYFRDYAARPLALIISRAIASYEQQIQEQTERELCWQNHYGISVPPSQVIHFLKEQVRYLSETRNNVEHDEKWGRRPPDIDDILARVGVSLMAPANQAEKPPQAVLVTEALEKSCSAARV